MAVDNPGGGYTRICGALYNLGHKIGRNTVKRIPLSSAGVETVRSPPRSPDLNAYAEHFVRSIKLEYLVHITPLGERHLRTTVTEYAEHNHTERNHQGLDNQLVMKPRDGPKRAVQWRVENG